MRSLDRDKIILASPNLIDWLGDPELENKLADQKLPHILAELLRNEICEEGDLMLLESSYTRETLKAWRDLGMSPDQIESLLSHTHIEDWVDGEGEAVFLQGLAFALDLREKLAPLGPFLIYLIFHQSETEGTACTVQYHKKRSEKTLWQDQPEWEILILET